MASGKASSELAASLEAEVAACILYGSETGNSEELAKSLYADLKARGVPATLSALDDFEFEELPRQKVVLLVCSTCGQGEFPSNSRQFWKKLSDPNLPMDFLSHTMFSVFGLGDSSYPQFCTAASNFDVRFQELGATRLMNRGIGDDRHEDKFYAGMSFTSTFVSHSFLGWDAWEPSLWAAMKVPKLPLSREIPKPVITVERRPGDAKPAVSDMEIRPAGTIALTMLENRLLTPAKYDRDIRHYSFDLKGTGLTYNCGDALAVYPKASPKALEKFYQLMGYNPTDELRVVTTNEARNEIPNELNIEQLFGFVLDTTGKPNRRFFDALSMFATDPEEKKALELLGSDVPEGKEKMRDLSVAMYNYVDVLAKFPSARPPLEHLMNMIPTVKPRLYSISSSNDMFPDQLHLTIIQVDWTVERDAQKELRTGLCTTHLKGTTAQTQIAAQVRKSAIELPEDVKTPIIMAGMGTGLAPWRGLTQQRVWQKRQGTEVGPVWLFFGARKAADEYLYREEFESYEAEGVLHMRTAFSRDQERKIYVQHRMVESGAELYDMMANQNAHFYVCGSAIQLPLDIYAAWKEIIIKHGKTTEDGAEALLTTWRLEKRYTVEVW